MTENFIENLSKKVFAQMQTYLTILYLLAIGTGMLFNYYKYKLFNINIFDYASIFDFLITPFADVNVLIFTICTLILTFVIYKIDAVLRNKYPIWYSKFIFGVDRFAWYRELRAGFNLIILIIYLVLAANLYGKLNYKQTFGNEKVAIQFSDQSSMHGVLIGKTSEFFFLLEENSVKAIPVSSIVRSINISLIERRPNNSLAR